MSLLGAAGDAQAQSGSFIIPSIRAEGGSDFAYWDLFERPPGSTNSGNFNYPNPPALTGGEDEDGNPTTVMEDHDEDPDTDPIPRTTLIQTGATDAFITSSNAIYSFSEVVKFEVPYQPAEEAEGMVTNVIFQTQTGGIRLDVNSVKLVYEQAGVPVTVNPVFRGLDDPQSGAFSERIVCAFQWNLTGLNVRDFKITFAAPEASMPLWQAQLDVVTGVPFVQELGYILATRSRPGVRFGRPGVVDKNLPWTLDGRYFLGGEELTLFGAPEDGWQVTGWSHDGLTTPGESLELVFPQQDTTVTALFAPESYATWRNAMFFHANSTIGVGDDYSNNSISGPTVDHDEDGLSNAGEYAFGGDPYEEDDNRTRPQLLLVEAEGQQYPALRYRTNGLIPGLGDVVQRVRVAANGGPWMDNTSEPTTTTVQRELQADGSELVTERALQAIGSFTSVEMDVAWSVGGVSGAPLAPAPLAITSEAALPAAQAGAAYSLPLAANGGLSPYTWELTAGDLPAGITLGTDGVLAGTPVTAGSFSFTVQVTDSFPAIETKAFSLTVTPYEITSGGTLPPRGTGRPVSLPLAVSGGSAPYSWSVTNGSLPEGISLTNAGVLSGTSDQAGEYQFTVQVQDDNGLTATKTFDWVLFDLAILTENPLPQGVVNLNYYVEMTLGGGTAPYGWQVQSGTLPAGLSLAANGVLSGRPLAAGDFSFTVAATDAGGYTATRFFNLNVLAIAPVPVVDPVVFSPSKVGANYDFTITASYSPSSYQITGLPKGLKFAVSNGRALISGRATTAGTYDVQIVATNATGSSVAVTAPLVVTDIPEGQLGTFTGLAARDLSVNLNLGSLVTLTTTSKGSFTVKVKTGGATKSAKGFLGSSAPEVQATVNGVNLTLTLDADTGLMSGTFGSAEINGWRNVWNKKTAPATSREGYYTVALDLADDEDIGAAAIPQGIGYAAFTVLPAGTLKVAGRSADGQAIVAATHLGPDGQVAVYAPVHSKKGSLMGAWQVSVAESGQARDCVVSGGLTWLKPATKGRIYPGFFGPVNLTVEGSWMGTATKRAVMEGLPETGALDITFFGGGIESSATVADVTGAVWTDKYKVDFSGATNAGKVKLTVQKAKGTVKGSFSLAETTPPLARKNVKMLGQVVKLADGQIKAAGYFLLPQVPTGGQKPNVTPILSGAFFLSQPVAAP
ncbi:Ig domain-containing protein [Prosthecobacter sp. SYSU 5D2]|uniref:Ig domain-containing protein n=1 Tax=Prosthecobacter sp. SYSU 5D2 TaxID=3134134 RepID=UPI0031FE8836